MKWRKKERSYKYWEAKRLALQDTTSICTYRIGRADNFLGKHARGPILTHDKGTSREANKDAQNEQIPSTRDQAGTSGRNRCEAKHRRKQDAGAKFITEGSQNEAIDNDRGKVGNGRIPYFSFGNAQGVSNLGH